MIKLFFFIVSFASYGQIINLPDVDFKAALVDASATSAIYKIAKNSTGDWMSIDTNSDGEIQQSEALGVHSLILIAGGCTGGNTNTIVDLTGLQFFTNLKYFMCACQQIPTINFSTLTNLKEIRLENNFSLTQLDVGGLANLETLTCYNTQISSIYFQNNHFLESLSLRYNPQLNNIDVTVLPALKYFDCQNNNIASLDISGLGNLKYLYCLNNQITAIQFQNNLALEEIWCDNNHLNSLDVNGLSALKFLNCYNNQLTSLNINSLQNLDKLFCGINQLTSLVLYDLPTLSELNCSTNLLTTLDFSSPNLRLFSCENNQLSTFNFDNLPLLNGFYCAHNQFTSLDFRNNPDFYWLACSDNNLTEIKIKNGIQQSFNNDLLSWSNNPNLTTFCIDDFEFYPLLNFLNQDGFNIQNLTINFNCNLDTTTFEDNNNVKIAPNPNRGLFTISGLADNSQIAIYDILGKKVHEQNLVNNQQIQLQNFEKGIYFTKIKTGDTIYKTQKILIE